MQNSNVVKGVLLGLFLIIMAAVIGWMIGNDSKDTQSTQNHSITQTETKNLAAIPQNWQEYKNEKYGFAFFYPRHFTMINESEGRGMDGRPGYDNVTELSFWLVDTSNGSSAREIQVGIVKNFPLDVNHPYQAYCPTPEKKPCSASSGETRNGIKTYITTAETADLTGMGTVIKRSVYLRRNTDFVIMRTEIPDINPEKWKDAYEIDEIFSTFQFLEGTQ